MQSQTKKGFRKVFIARNAAETFVVPRQTGGRDEFWRWGEDNLLPDKLASIARRAVAHRRIINDKADYIAGRGFSFDAGNHALAEIVAEANGFGETLRQVLCKIATDKVLFGNAFMEVVTDPSGSFLSLFHHDASHCRVARDSEGVILHHDWSRYKAAQAEKLPLFPCFVARADGTLRAMVHFKEYEPLFSHYGLPGYVAGMGVSEIACKTDSWNIARLENSFQLSGVMMIDADVESEVEAAELVRTAENRFAGRPGQVMFVVRDSQAQDGSRFIPINSSSEADWQELHKQAMSDIVVAHSWFRALSGMDYSGGFSSERILHEYEVALNTVILGQQAALMEPIRNVVGQALRTDASSLQIVNMPPTQAKPGYMKVWEARKADGLDFDPTDPAQQLFVAQLHKTS